MSKFHINKHGVPAPCKAKQGNCPLGDEDSHFDSQESAQKAADNEHKKEYGLIPENSSEDHGEIHETGYGLEYSVSQENNFSGYDETVADTHLNNYGRIYLDSYGHPIDNEYDIEEIHDEYKKEA